MALQSDINNMVEVSNTILKNCYGLKHLDELATNFEILAQVCKNLKKVLKSEGYVGVGLVVELFKKK
jgi:hypothetical protein